MEAVARIEACLEEAVGFMTKAPCPPQLAKAVHYAVFPGGARVRPLLCVSVASACSGANEKVADGAAAAIELLHCASLVHDDLPCFDDADMRRGRKSVQALYSEPLAVLVGDALIVEAFNTVTRACAECPEKLPALIGVLVEAVGMPGGIVAGQAWESEKTIDIEEYHRAKTGSLFVGAVIAGAIAVGSDPHAWRPLGNHIGAAYQIADDLLDYAGTAKECGKPVAQDTHFERPNAVDTYGLEGTMARLKEIVQDAVNSIPECEESESLKQLIATQATRLVPAKLAKSAA